MSSFVRKGGVSAADLGTRPGPAGQALASSGLADLDRLLGGGLPLGSLTLILEDGWSQHHITLLRYFLAEGTACGHRTLLAAAAEPAGGLASFLPRRIDPAAAAAEKEREKAEAGAGEEAVQLRIAWQYGRYLKPQGGSSSGSIHGAGLGGASLGGGALLGRQRQQGAGSGRPVGRDWCHEFDLSKPAGDFPGKITSPELSLISGTNARERLALAAAAFVDPLKAAPPQGPAAVGRVAVLSLGAPEWGLGVCTPESCRSVVQALLQLKAVVRDTRAAAVATVPAALLFESDRTRAMHVADTVLALEAVHEGSDIARLAPDASSVAGLLHVRKLPALGLAAAPVPINTLYIVRQRRRRLGLTVVEVDPEAEEAEAARVGGGAGGAATPAAALLCGGPAKGKPDLDF